MRNGALMTPTEYKSLEGQRIQAVLGAVAALPGAALVASGAEGAPMFAAGLIAVAAAFMCWIYTDGVYHCSLVPNQTEAEWDRLLRAGYRYQWGTFGYGALSIVLTLSGFAGVHSELRSPLTVGQGFMVDAIFATVVVVHIFWSANERNKIMAATRAVSIRNAQMSPPTRG